MLRVDHHLDVVADIYTLSDRHRAAVGISERDLTLTAGDQCLPYVLVVLFALPEQYHAFLQHSDRQVWASWGLAIGRIERLEVLGDLLINVLKCFRELLSGEIALAIVEGLELAAIDRDQVAIEQV